MIRPSTPDDLPLIMDMIANSRAIMRANGNASQWGNYPTPETILDDIARQVHFMVEDNGTPIGSFTLLNTPEPTYATIYDGSWMDDTTPYRTIHRLACAPGVHGIARQVFEWSEQQTASIRVDTHTDNHIMLHIIQKLGYTYCGIVHMSDGTPRNAFQKMTYPMVRPDLKAYVEQNILPRYNQFDLAHNLTHVQRVMAQSMELAQYYPQLDKNMVYTIAAYHDTGIVEGRDRHHIVSAQIIRQDPRLPEWFTPSQIQIMAIAAKEHRASLGYEPQTLYGKIVADADRDIEPNTIIQRAVQYSIAHNPKDDKASHCLRVQKHLDEKYGPEGYMKLYIPQSRNKANLERLQHLMSDKRILNSIIFETIDRYTL